MINNKKVMNRLLEQNVDESIVNYIDESLVGIEDKLEIAAIIYIRLAQLFCYSPTFVVDNDYGLVKDLDSITVLNNEIVCLHWAVIYSKLLDRYDVENSFLGDDKHLMVKVVANKYVIFADATRYGVEDRDYNLADLTNAKLGIKVKNFKSYSEVRNKDIAVILDKVYDSLGITCYDDNRMEELLAKFNTYAKRRMNRNLLNGMNKINRGDILYRIRFINWFYNMRLKLGEVERLQFFSKYFMKVFKGYNFENCRCLTLCETSEQYRLVRLLVIEDDNKEDYYFLETNSGFVEYNKERLMDYFLARGIVFKYDICGVLGFKDSEVKMLSKSKKQF